jgi:Cu/Ag efflux pump CusA
MAKMDINIFVQVGFVVLVGLAAKNAILVVEFAAERQKAGKSTYDATVEAGTTRLRPIVMTSFAFILGVFPLVIAHGAGAEMRRTLGVAVFSGMLGVTLFGIFLTPVFYYVVMRLVGTTAAAPRPALEPSGDGVLVGAAPKGEVRPAETDAIQAPGELGAPAGPNPGGHGS